MTTDMDSLCKTSMAARQTPQLLRRWLIFNAVGALGFVVQLATLMLLAGWLRWGVMPATALAVETAVIHNFFWHEHWTWADRAVPGWRGACWRFVRFNLTNGGLSIVGNLVFMRIFLDSLPLNYLAANTLSIAACSILTFIASDRLVFKGGTENSGRLSSLRPAPARAITKEES
jgi:putative flippase GtrA